MRKYTTAKTGNTTGNAVGNTIGMDMGDKSHKAVVIDGGGNEVGREEVPNTREAVGEFLGRHRGATLAIETGTPCRWVAEMARGLGLDAVVANARKVKLITKSSRKNDWNDAAILARLARTDRTLLHPVALRSAGDQRLMRLAKARETLVRCRTAVVNEIRGFCKAEGARLRKCEAEAFAKLRADLPGEAADVTGPLFEQLAGLDAGIKSYDGILREALKRIRGADAGRVMQIPGVGVITAAVFLASIGDVKRFGGKPRDAGPFLGLVPRQGQSGDDDPQLRITKEGNAMARRLLVIAANYIMGPFGKDSDLRRHGMRIAERGGKNAKRRAKIAVARRLAVTMLAMLMKGTDYRPLAEEAPPGAGAPDGGVAAATGGRDAEGT